jgi:hypothetical protein
VEKVMATFEEQRAAEKRLDEARKQLKILIVTFLKKVHELRRIEKGLGPDVEYRGEVNYSDWGGHQPSELTIHLSHPIH